MCRQLDAALPAATRAVHAVDQRGRAESDVAERPTHSRVVPDGTGAGHLSQERLAARPVRAAVLVAHVHYITSTCNSPLLMKLKVIEILLLCQTRIFLFRFERVE